MSREKREQNNLLILKQMLAKALQSVIKDAGDMPKPPGPRADPTIYLTQLKIKARKHEIDNDVSRDLIMGHLNLTLGECDFDNPQNIITALNKTNNLLDLLGTPEAKKDPLKNDEEFVEWYQQQIVIMETPDVLDLLAKKDPGFFASAAGAAASSPDPMRRMTPAEIKAALAEGKAEADALLATLADLSAQFQTAIQKITKEETPENRAEFTACYEQAHKFCEQNAHLGKDNLEDVKDLLASTEGIYDRISQAGHSPSHD